MKYTLAVFACAAVLGSALLPQHSFAQDPPTLPPAPKSGLVGSPLLDISNALDTQILLLLDDGLMTLTGDINLDDGTGEINFFEGTTEKAGIRYNGSFVQIENRETLGVGSVILDASSTGDIRLQTNDVNRLFITNVGNVGIGTNNPDFLLHVNGTAGKPGGGSWSVASDARLKDVQAPFIRAAEALRQIRPVAYRYKTDNLFGLPVGTTYIGVIAQELAQAIPEAVDQDANGYLQVNNDPVIWTMLNAINEQQAQIERLEAALQKQGVALAETQAENAVLKQTQTVTEARLGRLEKGLLRAASSGSGTTLQANK